MKKILIKNRHCFNAIYRDLIVPDYIFGKFLYSLYIAKVFLYPGKKMFQIIAASLENSMYFNFQGNKTCELKLALNTL